MNNELNKKALDTLEYLNNHGYFEKLELADSNISANQDPLDIMFYKSQQDIISEIYGELLKAYGELISSMLSYSVSRKFELLQEYSKNKYITINGKGIDLSRTPGNEVLNDLIKSEINELYRVVLLLGEGWLKRAENSIRTCRNHTYGGDNNGNR